MVYHLTGKLENRLSEFDVIYAIVLVEADIVLEVNCHFSASIGFCDIWGKGIWRSKFTHVAPMGAVYALCMT